MLLLSFIFKWLKYKVVKRNEGFLPLAKSLGCLHHRNSGRAQPAHLLGWGCVLTLLLGGGDLAPSYEPLKTGIIHS